MGNPKLKEALKSCFEALNETDYPFRLGEVVSVEGLSCTVKFIQGGVALEVDDIRLKSTLNEDENGLFHVPSIGSKVWVSLTGQEQYGFVVLCDQVSEVRYINEGMSFSMDAEKLNATLESMLFELSTNAIQMAIENSSITLDKDLVDIHSGGKINIYNDEATLKALLEDIISTIETITVSTGVGPSGTPLPPTLQKVTAIKSDITKLFS